MFLYSNHFKEYTIAIYHTNAVRYISVEKLCRYVSCKENAETYELMYATYIVIYFFMHSIHMH